MAASAPRARRRPTWLLAGVTALVVVGLGLTVVALLLRSPASRTSAPEATAIPTPSPPASSPSAEGQRQPQLYRAYVSMAVTHGTALAGATAGLADCRDSRAVCKQRIAQATDQVDQFQRDLSSNPAPACLSVADQRLHDGLSFEGRGLSLARQAIEARNRLKLAQGLLLVTVGTWRESQAIWAARHSDC